MNAVRQIAMLGPGRSARESLGDSNGDSDVPLSVTVVFTTPEGTHAALRAAGRLAEKLGARIVLVAPKVVPFHFPLGKPPVSIDFLERQYLALVSEESIETDEINIRIYLCRDRNDCLRKVLKPTSLVVMGGGIRRWLGRERRLERYLRSLGHHVVFVEMEARNHAGSLLRSYLRLVFRRVLGLYEGL